MFRTIISLLIALLVAVVIGAFQIVGLSVADITSLISSGDILAQLSAWGSALFQELLRPYSTFLAHGAFAPFVALGVAGFIAGLISKNAARMFFVSIITVALFFVGYVALSVGLTITLTNLTSEALAIAIDLAASFGLLFVPGAIGASLTAEDY